MRNVRYIVFRIIVREGWELSISRNLEHATWRDIEWPVSGCTTLMRYSIRSGLNLSLLRRLI